jgi:hypothetical protein
MRGEPHGARLVYVRADDLATEEFIVEDEWRDKALSILALLNGEYRDILPPALPEEEVKSAKTGEWKFPCGHCEYLTKCRGE